MVNRARTESRGVRLRDVDYPPRGQTVKSASRGRTIRSRSKEPVDYMAKEVYPMTEFGDVMEKNEDLESDGVIENPWLNIHPSRFMPNSRRKKHKLKSLSECGIGEISGNKSRK